MVIWVGLLWGCSYVPELGPQDFLRRALRFVDRALPLSERLVEATQGNDFGLMHRLAVEIWNLSSVAVANLERAVESPASGKPEREALKQAQRAKETASEIAIVLSKKLEGGEPQKLKDVDKQAARVLEALQQAKSRLQEALAVRPQRQKG